MILTPTGSRHCSWDPAGLSEDFAVVAVRTEHGVCCPPRGTCGRAVLLAAVVAAAGSACGADAVPPARSLPAVPVVIGEDVTVEAALPVDEVAEPEQVRGGPQEVRGGPREVRDGLDAEPAQAVTEAVESDAPPLPAEETLPPPVSSGIDRLLDEPLVIETESIIADAPVIPAPPETIDVSARAIDGMRIDDFTLDEMPFEASSGQWFWSGGWYAGGESLWMTRSLNNRRVIVQDVVDPKLKYTTMAGPFNVAPGARATIGRSLGRDHLDRDRSFEFIYYGGMAYQLDSGWNSATGQNSLVTPLAPLAPGFNFASSYQTSMSSGFNSWEWNYKLRRRLGRDQLVMSPGGNWTKHAERGWLPALMLGVRLANVDEDFTMLSTRPGTPASQFNGRYVINTNNWLLGLNLGSELISQNEFFYWGLRGRAAPAISFANVNQSATGVALSTTGQPLFTNFRDQASQTAAGFIGDMTLLAGWHITPNFALQVGYDFLWVAGMATTGRQFNLDGRDRNAIDAGGQTYYNGVSFGFQGSW